MKGGGRGGSYYRNFTIACVTGGFVGERTRERESRPGKKSPATQVTRNKVASCDGRILILYSKETKCTYFCDLSGVFIQ